MTEICVKAENGRNQTPCETMVDAMNAVPTFRITLDVMKQVSKQWAVLVDHWDELETLLNEEIGQRSAPKTYARMKELFKLAEAQND